jgi:leucyl aminopeptidase
MRRQAANGGWPPGDMRAGRPCCGARCSNIGKVTVTLSTSQSPAGSVAADALVIGIAAGPDGPVAAISNEIPDLTSALTALGATGEAEEITKLPSNGLGAPMIVAVGLGPAPFDPERLRRAAGAAVRELNGKKSDKDRKIAVAMPAAEPADAEAVATGALLGGYAFRRYRTNGRARDTEVILLTTQEKAARRGQVVAEAVALTRDLVNTAPLDLAPADLAAEAERVAAEAGVSAEVLDEKALAAGGYGGITGVGQGSIRPPRLVRLSYTGAENGPTVVFVGKGITFDSGGLSLKPPKSMETMKSDMGGAAAALAATAAVARLGLPVNVIAYLALAENMPGGAAQRPSDVISIYGGKTVEVLNTDAEGRLVMADALARSGADNPDLVVDIATLTGAQIVALGKRTMGVMGNSDAVAADVAASVREAGEPAWAMPFPEELRKGLDSTVADIANVPADRAGGMLAAGVFLSEFVPDGVRWAHLDIAGPAFNEGSAFGYTPKGGTGAAVRGLIQIVTDAAEGRLPGA